MKILPPLRHWLPALLKSRAGLGLAGTVVIVTGIAGALMLVGKPDTTSLTSGKAANTSATYEPAATMCSGLVLDRSLHAIVRQPCPPAAIRAGASIIDNQPLARANMPPRNNQLTSADRAIAVPQSLRTSVWDVGIAPNRDRAAPPATATTSVTTTRP